ncbi:Hypothetical_protein [Hexamita inflata]|uniref:Hypothetical_protein n=1 Tax=Hexamita inflata TaxID=28002 RepID=A0AA86THZ2_9EUKA|nr:Hypothetical protein HINF_LOCUS5820 [Hexamita inflata]
MSTKKNSLCTRQCGQVIAVSKNSLVKNWPAYEKQFKHIASSLNSNLLPMNREFIKSRFQPDQKFYFVRFAGYHSFDSEIPCIKELVRKNRQYPQEIVECIASCILEDSSFANLKFYWMKAFTANQTNLYIALLIQFYMIKFVVMQKQ